MSEKLCTLRTKGGGGGAQYTETSLWTNPSPTSNFPASASYEDVTLSDSMANYKYIKITYAKGVNYQDRLTSVIYDTEDILQFVSQSTLAGAFRGAVAHMDMNASNNSKYERSFMTLSNTVLRFYLAYIEGGTTTYRTTMIPTKIVGINELDHGTIQFKSGTFTTSGSAVANFSVNLGFKPRFLAIFFNGNSGSMSGSAASDGAVRYTYDATVNPSYGFRAYRSSSSSMTVNMAPVDSTGDTKVCEINNTGFVWRNAPSRNYNGTYSYFAIGEVSS